MEHFVAGTTARTAAALVGVNRNTAAYYFHRLRQLIMAALLDSAPFAGEVEVDAMRAISAASVKANAGEVRPARLNHPGFSGGSWV
ncbi:putative transposase [Salinisphaera hydrothermalis EPR70]